MTLEQAKKAFLEEVIADAETIIKAAKNALANDELPPPVYTVSKFANYLLEDVSEFKEAIQILSQEESK